MVFFLELVATGVRAFKLFRFVHHRDDEITKLKLRYIADIFASAAVFMNRGGSQS